MMIVNQHIMNNAELLNLMNLLESIQKTQEAVLEELKKLNDPIKVEVKELKFDGDAGYIRQ